MPLPEDLAPEPAAGSGALIGYARVSTSGQNLDRQILALAEAGCIRVFADKLSGKDASRPELAVCLDYLRPGDTLHLHCEILAVTPSKLHPSRGIVRVRMTTLNQKDQPVQTMVANLLAFRRPEPGA